MGGKVLIRRTDLLHPELSYDVVSVLFAVYNQLGPGHPEKYYQKAIAIEFTKRNIPFVEQYYVPLKFDDKVIGKYYLDFLIDKKIILEIKRDKYFDIQVINQTKKYLSALNLNLAIVACFTHKGVVRKRIVNI